MERETWALFDNRGGNGDGASSVMQTATQHFLRVQLSCQLFCRCCIRATATVLLSHLCPFLADKHSAHMLSFLEANSSLIDVFEQSRKQWTKKGKHFGALIFLTASQTFFVAL